MVEPLLTRFIRLYPERATPAGMGLRLELLGCQIEGTKFLAISEFYLNDSVKSNGFSTYGCDISTCCYFSANGNNSYISAVTY